MKPKQKKSDKENINLLYFNKNEHKVVNKTKVIGLVILIILMITIAILYIVYSKNEKFRTFCDTNILNKEVEENNLKYIELADYDKSNIFAFSKNIAVLKENLLTIYNSSGQKQAENKIEISNPVTCSNGKFFMIAEQDSSKVYLISNNEIRWEKNLEGNITKINVNTNGYSAVTLAGTAYKSVIVLFDELGNEIFRTYLSTTVVVDVKISDDNKYLSIAEVNTSGTLIQSIIKIISIDKAKEKPEEAIVYTYNSQSNSLIVNTKYQNKTRLVCAYDDSIHVIKDNADTKITDIDTKKEKITYSSINLNNHIVKIIEENSGLLNTTTTVKIINSTSQKENYYRFEGVIKELYCSEDKIALNLGSEIHFIDTNGWLIKKYTSGQEIRKVVMSGDIAGIVYRNKIEIIKL